MIGRIVKAILAALLPIAPWILAGVLGALLSHCAPVIGAGAKIQKLEADLSDAQATAKKQDGEIQNLEAWLKFERDARKADSDAATSALDEERGSCAARIEQARRSSARINDLLKEETHHDPTVCPDRRLLDPDRLRDAIG